MTSRNLALEILWRAWGRPYIWGGDDPSGFDCSGLAVEVLQSVGALPAGDWTAEGLRARFATRGAGCLEASELEPADLVFWLRNNGRAVHVEMILDPTRFAMGAAGGGPTTRTADDAWRRNAFVRVRPWADRPGPRVFLDPFS